MTSLGFSSYRVSGSVISAAREQRRPHGSSLRFCALASPSLEPLDHHHHHHRRNSRTARPNETAMTGLVVDGMPDTAVAGAGVMLNRRRSKARRRKRKELFGFQMCFAGILLGLVAGLRSLSLKAGEGDFLPLRTPSGSHDTCAGCAS